MKRLRKIIGDVLRVSPNRINEKTSPHEIKSWDSFHGLLLIMALEVEYNIKFAMEDIIQIQCVGDIKKCLARYGVKIEETK